MQHTLLPSSERAILRREYRVRVLIVLCFMASSAGVIGVVSLFPAYMRTSLEESSTNDALALIKKHKDEQGVGRAKDELTRDTTLIVALSRGSSQLRFSKIAEDIVRLRGNVRITSLAIAYFSTTTVETVVQGIAPNRDTLLTFKSRLESMSGSKVNLPVSALTKSSNIPFALQVMKLLP